MGRPLSCQGSGVRLRGRAAGDAGAAPPVPSAPSPCSWPPPLRKAKPPPVSSSCAGRRASPPTGRRAAPFGGVEAQLAAHHPLPDFLYPPRMSRIWRRQPRNTAAGSPPLSGISGDDLCSQRRSARRRLPSGAVYALTRSSLGGNHRAGPWLPGKSPATTPRCWMPSGKPPDPPCVKACWGPGWPPSRQSDDPRGGGVDPCSPPWPPTTVPGSAAGCPAAGRLPSASHSTGGPERTPERSSAVLPRRPL